VTYSTTLPIISWAVSNACPQCAKPLVLRRTRDDYRHVVTCLGYPRCRFASEYSTLVHALIDRITELEDAVEDSMQQRLTRE
jgi:ssDNA-binding Zn-finger/Zn-ribbon topoisomerase 1